MPVKMDPRATARFDFPLPDKAELVRPIDWSLYPAGLAASRHDDGTDNRETQAVTAGPTPGVVVLSARARYTVDGGSRDERRYAVLLIGDVQADELPLVTDTPAKGAAMTARAGTAAARRPAEAPQDPATAPAA